MLDYLKTFKKGKREDFERLLSGKLSDLLSEKQKSRKVNNLLQRLRREGKVSTQGRTLGAVWRLTTIDSDQLNLTTNSQI
jgi:hypothetical protein